jgi:hypothetical protein
MGRPIGTLEDIFNNKKKESEEQIFSEILNLRNVLGIKDKTCPHRGELLRKRGELRLAWEEQKRVEKQRKDRRAMNGYDQRLENSNRVIDSPYVSKQTSTEACETFGCQNVVYGNARFCDDCRKKKEVPKTMSKHYYPESVWKEAIPCMIHIRETLACTSESACDLYGKYTGMHFSLSGFYKYKREFNNDTTHTPPADLIEKCRSYMVVAPLPVSQPENKTGLTEAEEKALALFRQAVTQLSLDKVLDYISKIKETEEAFRALHIIQDLLNIKLSEVCEKRKKKQEDDAKTEKIEKERAELEKRLAELNSQHPKK